MFDFNFLVMTDMFPFLMIDVYLHESTLYWGIP